MGHARILSKLEDKEQQKELEEKIINDGISVRELENLTKEPSIKKNNPQKRKETLVEYAYIQEELSDKLGTKVVVKKNKLEISYANANDLNRILEILNIEVGK